MICKYHERFRTDMITETSAAERRDPRKWIERRIDIKHLRTEGVTVIGYRGFHINCRLALPFATEPVRISI